MQNVCGPMLAQRTKCARLQRGRIAAHTKGMPPHEGIPRFQNRQCPACTRCNQCLHWHMGALPACIWTHTCHVCGTYAYAQVCIRAAYERIRATCATRMHVWKRGWKRICPHTCCERDTYVARMRPYWLPAKGQFSTWKFFICNKRFIIWQG